jgi:uncharacterized protein YhbP (UPF0306 family)
MEASGQNATPGAKNAMNKTEKQLDRIAQLLRQQTTLSLATTGEDGLPCVAPLFYIVDEELILYWLSSQSSLHSQNINRTPRAAATVYRDAKSWKEIRGLQMRGLVNRVSDPKRRGALLKAYCERFKLGRVFRLAIRRSALYAFQPEFFRYIDNATGFGYKFELTHQPQGWTLTRPTR